MNLSLDLIISLSRKIDSARRRNPLDTRGNVDTITIKIRIVDDHITDVKSDSKPHTPQFGNGSIASSAFTLDVDSALHRLDYTGEFGQDAVAHEFHDSAAVLND